MRVNSTLKAVGILYTYKQNKAVGILYTYKQNKAVGILYTYKQNKAVGILYTYKQNTKTNLEKCESMQFRFILEPLPRPQILGNLSTDVFRANGNVTARGKPGNQYAVPPRVSKH
jgi:hypothetical protein